MVRFFSVFVLLLLTACGSNDIRKSISMEYLEAEPARPVVYPAGVDTPVISDTLKVPVLPASNRKNTADINELVQPPSLLTPEQRAALGKEDDKGKPVADDDEEDEEL